MSNRNKSLQTEDIQQIQKQSTHSTSSPHQDFAKSFMGFGSSATNFVNLNFPDIKLKGKDFYKKQPYCTICFRTFSTTFRQHHCRVCVNAVCNDCSRSMINKERSCDLCIMKYSNVHEEKKKSEILETLELMCAYMVYRKNLLMDDLEKIKTSSRKEDDEEYINQLRKQAEHITQLEAQNKTLVLQKYQFDNELENIRAANSKIENSINEQTENQAHNDITQQTVQNFTDNFNNISFYLIGHIENQGQSILLVKKRYSQQIYL